MIMHLLKFCSASEMFTFSNVPGLGGILPNSKNRKNRILNSILSYDWRCH